MALRLTTAKTAFETTRRPGEEALELGRAALAPNDLKRYRELFAECAQETDYNRAYKARRMLIELGLEKLGGTTGARRRPADDGRHRPARSRASSRSRASRSSSTTPASPSTSSAR